MNALISVIITCYNLEAYISRAIDSALGQSCQNIEIVVVNDGSRGNFDAIIKKYSNNKKIKFVICKDNIGLFAARIAGFKHSHGDYVAFLDADDSVSFDFYRTLLKKALETRADMVMGDTALRYSDIDIRYLNYDPVFISDISLSGNAVADFFMDQRGLCFTYYVVWNKLYKRSLLVDCLAELEAFAQKAGHITMCEDIAFSSVFWLKANKVVNVHNVFYYYTQHEAQETKRNLAIDEFVQKLIQVGKVFVFFSENLRKYSCSDLYQKYFKEWRALYARIWFSKSNMSGFGDEVAGLIKNVLQQAQLESSRPEDSFFGSMATRINPVFEHYENLKRLICSPDIEYVSFDIFDTLLLRPLFEPQDIFRLMTQEVNRILETTSYIDFHSLRVTAETECRAAHAAAYGIEDVNIDEIYQYLVEKFAVEPAKAEAIKQLELKTEAGLLRARRFGGELYDLALFAGKRIICISDMYLPESFISEQLAKNGYTDIERVFVSSGARVLKGTKNLYQEVLRQLDVKNPHKILHIGDSWQADVIAARSAGMHSGLMPNNMERLRGNNPGTYSGLLIKNITDKNANSFNMSWGADNFIGIRVMLGLAANKLFDRFVLQFNDNSDLNGNPFYIGYSVLGMHLYALCEWLKKQLTPGGTIHFVARDGYLLKKAMEIYAPDIRVNYLYISRKAIVPFIIENKIDMLALAAFIRWQVMSPAKIRELFCQVTKFDRNEFCAESIKAKFVPFRNFSSERNFIEFLMFFYDNCLEQKKVRQGRDKLRQYLDDILSDKDLIFDLGYSGRNEELFSKLLNRKINSAYIHVNADTAARRLDLSDAGLSTFYDTTPAMFVLLRESLFSEPGPSCVAYDLSGGQIRPVFEAYERKFQVAFYAEAIHQGALEFVRDFSVYARAFDNKLFYRAHDASIPYEYFLHFGRGADRELFRSWIFEDDLYGGVRLNVADYWEKLQQDKAGGGRDAAKPDTGQMELNRLREKYAALENELLKAQSRVDSAQARESGLVAELDRRWLLASLLYSSSHEKDKFSLVQLLKIPPEDIMGKIAFAAPPDFDEAAYCARYPDVGDMVEKGNMPSAYYHYIMHGANEGRIR